MGRFRTGLIAGGIIGILGMTMAISDRRTRKMVVKDGRIMRTGANRILDKLDII